MKIGKNQLREFGFAVHLLRVVRQLMSAYGGCLKGSGRSDKLYFRVGGDRRYSVFLGDGL